MITWLLLQFQYKHKIKIVKYSKMINLTLFFQLPFPQVTDAELTLDGASQVIDLYSQENNWFLYLWITIQISSSTLVENITLSLPFIQNLSKILYPTSSMYCAVAVEDCSPASIKHMVSKQCRPVLRLLPPGRSLGFSDSLVLKESDAGIHLLL